MHFHMKIYSLYLQLFKIMNSKAIFFKKRSNLCPQITSLTNLQTQNYHMTQIPIYTSYQTQDDYSWKSGHLMSQNSNNINSISHEEPHRKMSKDYRLQISQLLSAFESKYPGNLS